MVVEPQVVVYSTAVYIGRHAKIAIHQRVVVIYGSINRSRGGGGAS